MREAQVVATFALGILVASCSLVLSTADPVQCHATADCDGNPSLRGRVCESGFCVLPRAPVVPVSADGGGGCVSTELCTQANSNRPSLCKTAGGACIPLETADCPIVRGAWSDPDAIMIGVLAPMSYLQADNSVLAIPYVTRVLRGMDLALEEINGAMPNGLLVGDRRRRLAVVTCNSFSDGDRARRAFEHLTEVAGAQALIVMTDRDLAEVARAAAEKKTAIVCSDCVAPLPDGVLAWRHMPPIDTEAPLAAWRVRGLAEAIRSATARTTPIRVAVIGEYGPAPDAFLNALYPRLEVDGQKLGPESESLLAIRTENARVQAVPYLVHARRIADFKPDIIVAAVGPDFPQHYLSPIEDMLQPDAPRPHYVLSDLSYEVTPFVEVLSGTKGEDRRRRISGTHPRVTDELRENINQYALRYEAFTGAEPDSNFSGFESMYSLALSLTAASSQPLLDGPHISAGFESLVRGTAINYTPPDLKKGIDMIRFSGTVDARGLWSALDWDVRTRTFTTDAAMFCFVRNNEKLRIKDQAGDAYYSVATGNVTGRFECD